MAEQEILTLDEASGRIEAPQVGDLYKLPRSAVLTGGLVFNERADHDQTPTAGKGELWVANTTPNTLVFTDDAGTDTTLGAGGGGGGNSFTTIDCPAGTDPVADSSSDTLALASSTTALTITGSAAADSVTFAIAEAGASAGLLSSADKTKLDTLAAPISGEVAKTLGGGGDFATIDALFDWIADTPMSGVRLTVGVAAGTYAWDEQYVIGAGSGLDLLFFEGAATAATTIFQCSVEVADAEFGCIISGAHVHFEDIKLKNVVTGGSGQCAFAFVHEGGFLSLYQSIAEDFFEIAECQHASFELASSQVVCTNYVTAGWPVWAFDGSFVRISASSVTGTAAKQYYGTYIDRLSKCEIVGACSFVNLAGAVEIYEGGQILITGSLTLTTNTSNYNVTLNEVQGDGGFISNGGLTFATAAQGALAASAMQPTIFNAHTILQATTDNTPVALTVAEQTLVGRITAGNITALTATQVRTLLNVENGATNDMTAAEILTALLTVDGAASGLDADLLDGLSSAAFATAAQGATADAAVPKSLYDAQSIVAAVSDNTPVAVTVAEQTLVGRITGGNVDDLSIAQVRTLLLIEEIFSCDVTTVADQDYVLWYDAPFAGAVTKIRTESVSGTCTLTGKVNTTALGGTANSVSSTAQEQSHSSTNTFVKGDKIQFTISSNSSCLTMAVSFYMTRTS